MRERERVSKKDEDKNKEKRTENHSTFEHKCGLFVCSFFVFFSFCWLDMGNDVMQNPRRKIARSRLCRHTHTQAHIHANTIHIQKTSCI